MRSELVFGAMTYVSNRYLLVRLAARATREFHRPNSRIQETTNEVLARFREVNPLARQVPSHSQLRQPLRRAA